MKVDIQLNPNLTEPIITIQTPSLSEEVTTLIDFINQGNIGLITGIYEEKIELINPQNIIKIIAENKKTWGITQAKKYQIKCPLYEIEKRLPNSFIRISQSELINLNHIKTIDLSFIGTIRLNLSNNLISYCSRRYVNQIKQKLNL